MHAHAIVQAARARDAKIEVVAEQMNESTGLSWLWALLFGPLYYAAHGFWGRAILVFALNLVFVGFLVAPFLAYPAWRERARSKAERLLLLERSRAA